MSAVTIGITVSDSRGLKNRSERVKARDKVAQQGVRETSQAASASVTYLMCGRTTRAAQRRERSPRASSFGRSSSDSTYKGTDTGFLPSVESDNLEVLDYITGLSRHPYPERLTLGYTITFT